MTAGRSQLPASSATSRLVTASRSLERSSRAQRAQGASGALRRTEAAKRPRQTHASTRSAATHGPSRIRSGTHAPPSHGGAPDPLPRHPPLPERHPPRPFSQSQCPRRSPPPHAADPRPRHLPLPQQHPPRPFSQSRCPRRSPPTPRRRLHAAARSPRAKEGAPDPPHHASPPRPRSPAPTTPTRRPGHPLRKHRFTPSAVTAPWGSWISARVSTKILWLYRPSAALTVLARTSHCRGSWIFPYRGLR